MPSRHFAAGILSGVASAIGFARFIAVLPAFLLLETIPLLGLHVFGAVCGLIIVETIAKLLQSRGPDAVMFYLAFAAGATLFDGTALVFLPDVYGQTDLALTHAAAALLFGVGTFSIVAILRLGTSNKF